METIRKKIWEKEPATVVEGVLMALVGIVLVMAFLVIILGTFSSISDKWMIRQTGREYMLLMETEGYLTPTDEANLLEDLSEYGLYDISLDGTTKTRVGYGDRITLKITGTYDSNILEFAGGISKVGSSPTTVSVTRTSTAKQ